MRRAVPAVLVAVAAVVALGVVVGPSFRPNRAARPDPLTRDQVASLVLLGRVWGFVKYHHPRVTAGEVDWDAALRRAIPLVREAPTPAAARDTIDAWLATLGDPPPCRTTCATLPAELHLRPDVDWIRDEPLLGRPLSARLQRIYMNRSTVPVQRYVSLVRGVQNADFGREAAYAADSLPPPDLRLLAVFRFWNVLEYWFPYRDLMEPDRVAILREFVPAAWAATDVARYATLLLRLTARARDTHAYVDRALTYLPPIGDARVPLRVRFIEGRFVVTGYLPGGGAETGLEPGDVIVRVDGAPADSLARAWAPYYAASNEAVRAYGIGQLVLLKGPEGPVRLDIERDGVSRTVRTRRIAGAQVDEWARQARARPEEAFRMLRDDRDSVAYLTLSVGTAPGTASSIAGAAQRAAGTKAFVIDLRGSPRAVAVFALGNHLTAEVRPFVQFATPRLDNPGAFVMNPLPPLVPAVPQYQGRVVILVDERTFSQGEYTAMAFRAIPGALVVGSTTAGADGNTSRIVLPGGWQAYISGAGVFYPDGRPTQQVGIVPDLEVRPTIAGIRAGRDEVLEAAVSRVLGRGLQPSR